MFVWIPRYAYKITSGYHDGRDDSGKVTNYTTASYYDYVVHPAFDWEEEKLEGIWIAKYEASASATQNIEEFWQD